MMDLKTMEQKLQSALLIDRFIHTLGVRDESKKLAEKYGDEKLVEKAEIAGLLHDCAKNYPNDLKKSLCKEFHIKIDDVMKQVPDLMHPFLGAEVANREYEVEDVDILNAIRFHTTGRPNMSVLEKIVFIADYIEPNRKPFEGLEEARKLAYQDLDKAMEFILHQTITYVKHKGKGMHPLTLEAYEFYKNGGK